MASGWVEDVVAEAKIAGGVARIVESRYEARGTASRCASDLMLRWRMWPDKINIRTGERCASALSGRMLCIPSDVQTVAEAGDGSERTRSLALQLDPDWLMHVGGWDRTERASGMPKFCPDMHNANIESTMRRMSAEIMTPDESSTALLEALCVSVSIDLSRHFRREGRRPPHDPLTRKRVEKIEEYVLNCDYTPSLADVASVIGVGVGYLRQIYKESTGRTLFSYIEEVRVARGCTMLTDQARPLKVISHKLGFCTPSAFSSAFRKATGMTPREYRVSCS